MPPQTLKMHSTNSNQVLYESNVHKYTSMTQIKTYNVGMCTHAHLMLPNTSKEHQSNTCAPPNSKWPPKPQSSSKALQTPPRLRKRLQNLPKVQTCTSNTHKPSRSLSMHTSNQTSNHATRMCGPITYWKTIGLEERLRNQKHIEHTSMWTMLGVRETNSPPTLLFIPFHVPRHWQTIWDNYFFPSLFKHVRGINIFQIYLCLWLLATLIYHIVSIIYIIIFNIFNNVVMQPKGTFEDAIFVVNILIFFQLNIFNAKNIPKMAF